MKNLFFIKGITLLTILSLTIVGCKKEETHPKTQNTADLNMTSDKRMLTFNSSSNYANIISNPSTEFQKEFLTKISTMDYTSYAEKVALNKSTNDVVDDEYLSQILNEDLIVQIGDYLYRVNMESGNVFVLPASHIDEYQDLVNENKANKNIRKFSTSDYVIELAENGNAGEKSLFCGEDGCGGDRMNTSGVSIPFYAADGTPSEYLVSGYSEYLHAGVYFCLKGEAMSNSGNVRIYVNVENAWDKVKCGATDGATSYPWYQNNSTYSTQQTFRKYNGIQPLNGMHMKMRVSVNPNTSGGYTTYFTTWSEIRTNSPY